MSRQRDRPNLKYWQGVVKAGINGSRTTPLALYAAIPKAQIDPIAVIEQVVKNEYHYSYSYKGKGLTTCVQITTKLLFV